MRGELPFQMCKTALDSVEFLDKPSEKEIASGFADIVTQMAQDVSFSLNFFDVVVKDCFILERVLFK